MQLSSNSLDNAHRQGTIRWLMQGRPQQRVIIVRARPKPRHVLEKLLLFHLHGKVVETDLLEYC